MVQFIMKHNSAQQIKEEILADPFFGDAVEFILNKLGNVQNKVILDSGCGSGQMSVFFALQGAKIIGIDKKSACIDDAITMARSFGVESNCSFLQGCSESIPIDSNSIDVIFSKSTIQYMEREKVLDEYIRVLKPDGCIALIENLPHNPLINLYRLHRKLLARTKEEEEYASSIRGYITPNEIESLGSLFRYSEHYEYHLFRMISMYLGSHSRQNFFTKGLDDFLSYIDKQILSLSTPLKRLAWFTVLYCNQKNARSPEYCYSDKE
jgi:ubiquinone/menaquinone biosynthesis C-methylase UbiE